jgi:hypothetical protein
MQLAFSVAFSSSYSKACGPSCGNRQKNQIKSEKIKSESEGRHRFAMPFVKIEENEIKGADRPCRRNEAYEAR